MIVTLTGFMLSGKSTYGKSLATALGWDFKDLDEEIVLSSDYGSVSAIFMSGGEQLFRDLESAALEKTLSYDGNLILALGGGTVDRELNRRMIIDRSYCIWLSSSLNNSVYSPRFASFLSSRPILAGKTRGDVEDIYNRRIPLYRSIANQTIVTDGLTDDIVIKELLDGVNSACLHSWK